MGGSLRRRDAYEPWHRHGQRHPAQRCTSANVCLTLPCPPWPSPLQHAELRSRLEQVQSADVLVSLMDTMRAEMQRQGIRWGPRQPGPQQPPPCVGHGSCCASRPKPGRARAACCGPLPSRTGNRGVATTKPPPGRPPLPPLLHTRARLPAPAVPAAATMTCLAGPSICGGCTRR